MAHFRQISENIRQRFIQVFTLDLRALSILRIGIALIIISDLIIRSSDLEVFYTNDGVLSLQQLFSFAWNPDYISFHAISGSWYIQAILFLIAGFFAVCLLTGYQVRLATFMSWLLLLSLHNRNVMLNQGGDDLLRMTLFWGMFLPWGKYYSISALKYRGETDRTTHYFGMAGAAYMIQIAMVYFVSALQKYSAEWVTDGTAIYYALSLDQMVFSLGKALYPHATLLKYLTFSVYYIELIVPLLFFIPFYNGFFRMAAIIIIAALHAGISLTLFVGLFFIIGLVTLTGLIPGSVMGKLSKNTGLFTELLADILQEFERFFVKYLSVKILFRFPVSAKNIYMKSIRDSLLLFALLYIMLWNAGNVSYSLYSLDPRIKWIGNCLRIDQNWGMFAPTVFKDDGWFILEAKDSQGRIVDLNKNAKTVSYDKPEHIVSMFKNDRWRKYSENYLFISNTWMRPAYCNYMLRKWNLAHPSNNMSELKVVYMKEITQPDYKYSRPTHEVLCDCR